MQRLLHEQEMKKNPKRANAVHHRGIQGAAYELHNDQHSQISGMCLCCAMPCRVMCCAVILSPAHP